MSVKGGDSSIGYAFAACMFPYLPGDAAKIIVAQALALALRPVYKRITNANANAK
jgi:biotin transporter BioY